MISTQEHAFGELIVSARSPPLPHTALLLSDDSQTDEKDVSYPPHGNTIRLTEIVRCTQRLAMAASAADFLS